MDYIVRATAANAQIRAFAATTRDLVEKARKAHNTSPVATAALGRLMTGAVMMGVMAKNDEDLLTLQVSGDGPLKGMTVTADGRGNVKGYANEPLVMLPPSPKGKLDVGGAVGRGFLRVIKDIGLKEPYSGQTDLQTGEIAEDLTYYFATSEQVPSSVGLGVLMEKNNTVRQAGAWWQGLRKISGKFLLLLLFWMREKRRRKCWGFFLRGWIWKLWIPFRRIFTVTVIRKGWKRPLSALAERKLAR